MSVRMFQIPNYRLVVRRFPVRISAHKQAILTGAFGIFPQSLQTTETLRLKIRPDRFLPIPFQFVIYQLLCHRLCII